MRCGVVFGFKNALNADSRLQYKIQNHLSVLNLRLNSNLSQAGLKEKEKDENISFHKRANGEKPLPLPPVLNPALISARQRHRLPKAGPSGNRRTVFQQRLYRNAYACALASKPRSCRASAIRIPAYFTVTYIPGVDSVTSDLVYLPSKMNTHVGLNVRLLATYDNVAEASIRPEYITSRLTESWLNKKNKPKWPRSMPDQTLEMLRSAVKRSLKWALKHPKAGLIEDCKGAMDIVDKHQEVDEIEWDCDQIHPRSAAPAAVLYLVPTASMALRLLKEFHSIEKEVEAISQRFENLQRKWNGKPKPKEFRYRDMTMARSLPLDQLQERFPVVWHRVPAFEGRRSDIDQQQLPQTAQQSDPEPQRRPVPVYDLTHLLGEEGTRELVEDTIFKDAHCLVLKDVRLNLEGQMHLYKLQGYLKVSEDYFQ